MPLDFDALKKKYGRIFVWIFLVFFGLLLLNYTGSAQPSVPEQLGGSNMDLHAIKDLLNSFDLT